MISAVAERAEASPAALIVIGAIFMLIGLSGLWARSHGRNLFGTVAPVGMTLMALSITLLGLVLLLAS
jgi:hypothetical protein